MLAYICPCRGLCPHQSPVLYFLTEELSPEHLLWLPPLFLGVVAAGAACQVLGRALIGLAGVVFDLDPNA